MKYFTLLDFALFLLNQEIKRKAAPGISQFFVWSLKVEKEASLFINKYLPLNTFIMKAQLLISISCFSKTSYFIQWLMSMLQKNSVIILSLSLILHNLSTDSGLGLTPTTYTRPTSCSYLYPCNLNASSLT